MSRCQFENLVQIIGIIDSDPITIHKDPLGCRFRILTKEIYYSKRQCKLITQTEKHNCKIWQQQAIFTLANIQKGDYVYVRGKLHHHIKEISDDRKIKLSEIIVEKISKLDNSDSNIKTIESNISVEKNSQ